MVASLAAAVVLSAASNRPSATDRPEAAETAAKAGRAVPSTERADAQHEVAAPVGAVDEIGTRRLTGRSGTTVALTFDDGPHPRHTPEVLAILGEHGVVATFCVVGHMVEAQPDLVRRIAEEGHALCDHTTSHDMELRNRSAERIQDEIAGTLAAITAAAPGAEVPFFRAPGGHFAENLNEVATSLGQVPLGWSIDTRDWRQPGAAEIRDRVLHEAHPGAVVLMHDGGGDRTGTVEALPGIISGLADLGYEFVVPAS